MRVLNGKKVLALALANLTQVDIQMDRLREVLNIELYTESYWYQLYRIATCSLNEQSYEIEIKSVRLIQSLVLVETFNMDDNIDDLFTVLYEQVITRYAELAK